jgi:hypothetical protein
MEKVGIFHDHLVYFTAVWYSVVVIWYIFYRFCMFEPRDIWANHTTLNLQLGTTPAL